jgi:hypothetical protein
MHISVSMDRIEVIWFILPQPRHSIVGKQDIERLAGYFANPVSAEGCIYRLDLCNCALVKPYHRRPDGISISVKNTEGLSLVRNRNGGNSGRINIVE